MNCTELMIKGQRIRIFGSFEDKIYANLKKLTGIEITDRMYILYMIEEFKVKADILYNGNTVYNKGKILRNLKQIKKHNDMSKMTNYTYEFLSLACGSIAHYNKAGWIACYPTVRALRNFFHKNEFGTNIVDHQPKYNSSNEHIAREILKLFP